MSKLSQCLTANTQLRETCVALIHTFKSLSVHLYDNYIATEHDENVFLPNLFNYVFLSKTTLPTSHLPSYEFSFASTAVVLLAFYTVNSLTRSDNIPSIALKLAGTDLSLLLNKFFNLSQQQGCFPNHLNPPLASPTHNEAPITILVTFVRLW